MAAGHPTMGRQVVTALSLHGVGHAYLGRMVIDRINLEISKGELVALVGPSGCGKSTLAQVAAGLIEPMRGHVERRYARHGFVFQEPRLLPWATAAENIAYPLKLAGINAKSRRARVAEAAAAVALETTDLAKYPAELSGGMRQRAAIARALTVRPDLLFCDEPFTALDVALKRRMQDLVISACRDRQLAGLFITHDVMEAARLADRVVVLDTSGDGLAGERLLPGHPGERDDGCVFAWAQQALNGDPLFRHIHDVDERRLP